MAEATDQPAISRGGLTPDRLGTFISGVVAAAEQAAQARVAQAGQLTKGPFHAPGGVDQAAGGASGLATPMGWVADPQAPIFQYLARYYPKVAAALQRAPAPIEFSETPVGATGAMGGAAGQTIRETMAGIGRGPITINIPPAMARPSTYPHEALHALYLANNPVGATSQPPASAARDILRGLEPGTRTAILGDYKGDWGHAALAKIAYDLYARAGRPPLPGASPP